MCRNIKMLFNFDPPVTDDEIRAASLQLLRSSEAHLQLLREARAPGRRVPRRARHRATRSNERGPGARSPCDPVSGLVSPASRYHREDDRSVRPHGYAAPTCARQQAAQLGRPPRSRGDHGGGEAGLARSPKVNGHGTQGIPAVPQRAWLLQGRARARRADHPGMAAVDPATLHRLCAGRAAHRDV